MPLSAAEVPCLQLWRPVIVGRSGNRRRYTAHTHWLETTGQTGSWCKPAKQKCIYVYLVRSHLRRLGKGYVWPAHKTPPQSQASFCSLYCSLPFERWCWTDTPRQAPRCRERYRRFPCSLPALRSQLRAWKIFREFGEKRWWLGPTPLWRAGKILAELC